MPSSTYNSENVSGDMLWKADGFGISVSLVIRLVLKGAMYSTQFVDPWVNHGEFLPTKLIIERIPIHPPRIPFVFLCC
jgi:hypothetical protein